MRALGTITLNHAVGGLNATAVEVAARQGARIVWLPTVSAGNEFGEVEHADPDGKVPVWVRFELDLRAAGVARGRCPVVDDAGAPLPELLEVLAVVARHDLVLATGHLSRDEIFTVVDAARRGRRADDRRHPPRVPVPAGRPDEQRALAARGALMERAFTTPYTGKCTWDECSRRRAPSARASTVWGTDLGQRFNPPVEDGLAIMADRFLEAGFSEEEVRIMAVENTRRVAGCGMSRRVQVIGAHSADFVWRAGGAVAKAVAGGGTAEVIALSYGERGESGELWKQEGQTIENVKRIRHAEAEAAAAHLGATFRCLDLGDYPLQIDGDALLRIADAIREFAPDVLITHTDTDPFNPDHPVAHAAVDRARGLAAGAGVSSAFPTIKPPQLFLFEPHQPELCNFTPTVHVDITAVWEQKVAAMAEMQAQQYLQTYYAQRGEQRGNHARRASGDAAVRYGRVVPARLPQVVDQL